MSEYFRVAKGKFTTAIRYLRLLPIRVRIPLILGLVSLLLATGSPIFGKVGGQRMTAGSPYHWNGHTHLSIVMDVFHDNPVTCRVEPVGGEVVLLENNRDPRPSQIHFRSTRGQSIILPIIMGSSTSQPLSPATRLGSLQGRPRLS